MSGLKRTSWSFAASSRASRCTSSISLQLKEKLAAATSNQVEKSSKVDIRNIQKALGPNKTELTGCRTEPNPRFGDQDQQLKKLRARKVDL